jgi:hypothetical protein
MSIVEFCELHQACKEGSQWAISECETMEDVWAKVKPEWLIWVATRPGVLTDRDLRLFAVFCARQVEYLMADDRSRHALDVAERFANGHATKSELDAASASASASTAASAATYAASAYAASADAARAAAWAAARATRDSQADWLRKNTTPNFGGE